MKNNLKEAIKFIFIGATNTLISLAFYFLLVNFKVNYILSSIIVYIFGILFGYYLNSMFTFRVSFNIYRLSKYSLIYMISLAINIIFLIIFVKILGLGKFLAQIFTALLMVIINYYTVKVFVFKISKVNNLMVYQNN